MLQYLFDLGVKFIVGSYSSIQAKKLTWPVTDYKLITDELEIALKLLVSRL